MIILSAVQFKPNLAHNMADVHNNLRRCEPLIHDAWKVGSQLVVFPELFLTGYAFTDSTQAASVAERKDGPTFRTMRDIAIQLDCYVAYGYVESDGNRLYNSAQIIGPDGVAYCQYRKVNLWGNDFLWATPGASVPDVVRTPFGNLSVVICRDIRAKIPDNIPRVASTSFFDTKKPDIVAACANWGKGGFPSTSWMDFAANHKCSLVVANRYGVEQNNGYELDFGCGGSIIIEKDWNVHTAGLKFNNDCVVTAVMEKL